MNGISLGIVATSGDSCYSNGLIIGGFGAGAVHHNGIALGGIGVGGTKLNGIGISAVLLRADTLNGFFVGGWYIAPNAVNEIIVINGLAVGGAAVMSKKTKWFSNCPWY